MSNSDINHPATEIVEVTIFNQTYRLRSKTNKEQLQQIASLVDERMRQISAHIPNQDIFKIAVLTALNIADEMQNLKNYYEQEIEPLLAKFSHNQEAATKQEITKETTESNKSWFEDFFEAKVETKDRAERLSSQVSAKLQTLRESSSDQIGITTEEMIE
jgi:cell division protein ZapA